MKKANSESTETTVVAAVDQTKYMCTVSFLEIYNEEIKDLLNPSSKTLNIREHPQMGIYVENLCELIVKDSNGIMKLIDQGNAVRRVAATNMNDQSSRSHSCFTIKVERKIVSELGNGVTREKSTRAKLNLVDLAGSERQVKTGATGDTLKEGASINMSLMALGNVINALSESGKSKHIPYRDSKLTRLLQESLGGNAGTVMIAAISPADYNYDETVSTLKYANRAKSIANAMVRNEDQTDKMIRNLKEQIEALKKQLETGGGGGGGPDPLLQVKLADMEKRQMNDWEEKMKLQEALEAERQQNLNSAIADVMTHVREDKLLHMKNIKRLGDEKNRVSGVLKESKMGKEKLKHTLDESMQRYQVLQKTLEDITEKMATLESHKPKSMMTSADEGQDQGQADADTTDSETMEVRRMHSDVSAEITMLLLDIETQRACWVSKRDAYKNAKDKLVEIDKDIDAERVELVATSTILQQNDRIRLQIQEEERLKAKDSMAEELENRTKQIQGSVEESFQIKMKDLSTKLSEQNQINITLESKVSGLMSEVEGYISRVAGSEVDLENALKEIERVSALNTQNEAIIESLKKELANSASQQVKTIERLSASHKEQIEDAIKAERAKADLDKFDMFKSLCDGFEEERAAVETKHLETKQLLSNAAKDIVHLSRRNEELSRSLMQALQWEPTSLKR